MQMLSYGESDKSHREINVMTCVHGHEHKHNIFLLKEQAGPLPGLEGRRVLECKGEMTGNDLQIVKVFLLKTIDTRFTQRSAFVTQAGIFLMGIKSKGF